MDSETRTKHAGALVIGVSGAIAGGKTTVARMLGTLANAPVISADAIAHELLETDEDLQRQIANRWGEQTRNRNGGINRAKLAEKVFSDPDELEELNRIIHPRIINTIDAEIKAHKKDPNRWIILDAALLFETNLQDTCDILIFVETDHNVRAQRARQRGWSIQELDRRQQAQLPLYWKQQHSDYTVNNNGNEHETKRQIERIITDIKRHRRTNNG